MQCWCFRPFPPLLSPTDVPLEITCSMHSLKKLHSLAMNTFFGTSKDSAIAIALTLISTQVALVNGVQMTYKRNFPAHSITETVSCVPSNSPSLSCALGPGQESHQIENESSSDTWPYQIYQSASFNPPELQITRNGQPLAPGLLFISPELSSPVKAAADLAPIIMTDAGELIWNGPNANATNFRVASYHGSPILTYWTGITSTGLNIGHGYGNVTFLDASYNIIHIVCPHLGLVTPDNTTHLCDADLHESFLTDRETLLVTAYNVTQADLSSIGGGQNGWIYDCLFFELDVNGNILFRWSAIELVPVIQSKFPLESTGANQSAPFDYFHINSVVSIGNEYYLVNSRHLWTTYLVNTKGEIIWTLQGDTGGDFGTIPANGKFVCVPDIPCRFDSTRSRHSPIGSYCLENCHSFIVQSKVQAFLVGELGLVVALPGIIPQFKSRFPLLPSTIGQAADTVLHYI